MDKLVIIMRGPSGSGKSTYAKNYGFDNNTGVRTPSVVTVSADDFFMQLNPETGQAEYMFNPMQLGEAHSQCLRNFLSAIQKEAQCIIVDNTNIHLWEYAAYVQIAKMHGYKIKIVQFVPKTIEDIKTCIERTQHGVPTEIIARMCVEFEEDTSLLCKETLEISP
jgi:predicted kinase